MKCGCEPTHPLRQADIFKDWPTIPAHFFQVVPATDPDLSIWARSDRGGLKLRFRNDSDLVWRKRLRIETVQSAGHGECPHCTVAPERDISCDSAGKPLALLPGSPLMCSWRPHRHTV